MKLFSLSTIKKLIPNNNCETRLLILVKDFQFTLWYIWIIPYFSSVLSFRVSLSLRQGISLLLVLSELHERRPIRIFQRMLLRIQVHHMSHRNRGMLCWWEI